MAGRRKVGAFYRDDLGRAPDAGVDDLAAWRREPATLGTVVVRDTWCAPEAVRRRITAHHRDLLSRLDAPKRLAPWCGSEEAGDVGVQVAVASFPGCTRSGR